MSNPKKVAIIGGGSGAYRLLFAEYGFSLLHESQLENADLILFTGGEDVHPSLYQEEKHPHSYSNIHRDIREASIYEVARGKGIPMVGICRGGQFLNVMNKGWMYQDVNNHGRPHNIMTPDGVHICLATSTHHQMMIPHPKGVILAVANESSSRERMCGGSVLEEAGAHDDTEVVYYDDTKCLCFQPHPEIGPKELKEYFFSLIKDYLGVYHGEAAA